MKTYFKIEINVNRGFNSDYFFKLGNFKLFNQIENKTINIDLNDLTIKYFQVSNNRIELYILGEDDCSDVDIEYLLNEGYEPVEIDVEIVDNIDLKENIDIYLNDYELISEEAIDTLADIKNYRYRKQIKLSDIKSEELSISVIVDNETPILNYNVKILSETLEKLNEVKGIKIIQHIDSNFIIKINLNELELNNLAICFELEEDAFSVYDKIEDFDYIEINYKKRVFKRINSSKIEKYSPNICKIFKIEKTIGGTYLIL